MHTFGRAGTGREITKMRIEFLGYAVGGNGEPGGELDERLCVTVGTALAMRLSQDVVSSVLGIFDSFSFGEPGVEVALTVRRRVAGLRRVRVGLQRELPAQFAEARPGRTVVSTARKLLGHDEQHARRAVVNQLPSNDCSCRSCRFVDLPVGARGPRVVYGVTPGACRGKSGNELEQWQRGRHGRTRQPMRRPSADGAELEKRPRTRAELRGIGGRHHSTMASRAKNSNSGAVRLPIVKTLWKRLVVRVYGHTPTRLRMRLVRLFTPNFTAGVATLLVRDDTNEVLFLRSTYRKGWGLPGGLLGRNEMPEVTAKRELEEELGISIDVPPPYRVSTYPPLQTITFFTLAHVTPQQVEQIRIDPVEVAEVHWFAVQQMPELDREIAPLTEADREAVLAALT
jgi:8-oxo-dGTP pyrophosphatase MutT (NUDIX family)